MGYNCCEKPILIEVNEVSDKIEISTVIDDIKFFSTNEIYFVAYQKFRDNLLELGYGLQCNGSKINAIQSGMMEHCEKIYLVEMGKQALTKQIVCIWDYADIDFFSDTKMQLDFADKWYKSI